MRQRKKEPEGEKKRTRRRETARRRLKEAGSREMNREGERIGRQKNGEQKGIGKKNRIQKQRPAASASAAWLLLPLFLVLSAAALPVLVFGVQDNIRCGKAVLGELEDVDIASFNTGYETDLYRRLLRFAEGKSKGESFYAAAQELDPDAELTDFLNSVQGLYQTSFLVWIDNGAIPKNVLEYSLQSWKQYVIYGDDFSAGVNFILWYIELSDSGTSTLKLLMDAETGDLYGISFCQTEEALEKEESILRLRFEEPWTVQAGIDDEDPDQMSTLWYSMACRFGGMDESTVSRTLRKSIHFEYNQEKVYEENISLREQEILKQEEQARYDIYISSLSDADIREILLKENRIRWEISEDEKTHTYFFFYEPEGNDETCYELPFCCRIDQIMMIRNRYKRTETRVGEFFLGFPDIYEWVPEFTETTETP